MPNIVGPYKFEWDFEPVIPEVIKPRVYFIYESEPQSWKGTNDTDKWIVERERNIITFRRGNISFSVERIDDTKMKMRGRYLDELPPSYRKLAAKLGIVSTVVGSWYLVHASCILHKGKVIVFFGNSGAGKTTIALKMKKKGDGIIGDDNCFINLEKWKLIPSPFNRIYDSDLLNRVYEVNDTYIINDDHEILKIGKHSGIIRLFSMHVSEPFYIE